MYSVRETSVVLCKLYLKRGCLTHRPPLKVESKFHRTAILGDSCLLYPLVDETFCFIQWCLSFNV